MARLRQDERKQPRALLALSPAKKKGPGGCCYQARLRSRATRVTFLADISQIERRLAGFREEDSPVVQL